MAEPAARGPLVTVNVLCIAFGQFAAGMVDGLLADTPHGWRLMLGLAAVPSLVMLVGFFPLPESPRWLVQHGRRVEALKVLKRFRVTDEAAEAEIISIVDGLIAHEALTASVSSSSSSSFSSFSSSFAAFSHPPTRRALFLGCGLMFLQQFAGINTVMYYAASIYEMAGYSRAAAIWLSGFTALAQVAGIAISIFLVERAGRRTLLLGSLAGVTVSLAGMGASFYFAREGSGKVEAFDGSGDCEAASAAVWSGVTVYCYDCVRIEGCGFCGNSCLAGDESGPFGEEQCPVPGGGGAEWGVEADSCTNPYAVLSCVMMVSYLFTFGLGMVRCGWPAATRAVPSSPSTLLGSFAPSLFSPSLFILIFLSLFPSLSLCPSVSSSLFVLRSP